jgi:hypothetical protein
LEKVPYAGLTMSKLLARVSEPLFEIYARRLGFTIFPQPRLPEFYLPETIAWECGRPARDLIGKIQLF